MATATQRRAEAQRAAQARLAAALVQIVGRAYAAAVTPATLSTLSSQTYQERFVTVVLPTILAYRRRSEALASVYLRGEGVDPLDPPDLPTEAVVASLTATGLAGLFERIGSGTEPAEAIERAGAAATGAADRHVLNGGRSLLATSVQARTDVGYYRVTRGDDACYFCKALESRGAVYGPDSFAESDPRFMGNGEIKVHDNCHCTWGILQRGEAPPERAAQMYDLWKASTEGRSGTAAMRAFRRAVEAQRRMG